MFPVAEHFISINGEGTRAGEIAAFIRFRLCNLNCSYCDTKWANNNDSPAEFMSAEELTNWVIASGVKNVTLTGGEPLLQRDLKKLVDMLMENGLRVEIETNGSIPVGNNDYNSRPVFTIDYKLPSSGEEKRMHSDNFRYLNKNDTVKFVAGSKADLIRAAEVIDEYNLCEQCHVYFSPVFGKIEPVEIVNFLIDNKLSDVRLQLQLHKYIWDPEKRGV